MSKLCAHLLNGKKVGVEINNYAIIEVPFVAVADADPIPSGYADISSVVHWYNFGEGLEDYLYIRREIKSLIKQKGIDDCQEIRSTPPITPSNDEKHYIDPNGTATGAWVGYEGWCATWDAVGMEWVFEPPEWLGYRVCTQEEKDIAAKLKIGSQGDHFADYGVPAIVDYGFDYHKQSRDVRIERMLKCTVEVYNIIPLHAAESLADITSSPLGDMYSRYIEFGVKGTVEDFNKDFNPSPTPGICDWIYARAPFSNVEPYISAGYPSGLTLKGWTPIDGTTLNDFATKIYNILVYGNIAGS